jgi:hypothetical protein
MPVKFPCLKLLLINVLLIFILQSAIQASKSEYLIKLPDISALQKSSSISLNQFLDLSGESSIAAVFDRPNSILSGWYIITTEKLAEDNLQLLKSKGKIQYYQENHVLRVQDVTPNDPLYKEQWYHRQVNTVEAWTFYQPKADVLLAVIDTGIDYNHPDLQGSLWVNPAEDINSNGIWDPDDENGIDDDNNGYIDDIQGWDFTDAPRYRDLGDYIDPDNEPMDEYFNGHGTQIAGIIAAQTNNEIGISGMVPGAKIMNLRAGTSQGYLEEDDVARAIVYAVESGAHIINMSFGDIVISPFLVDAIRYAYSKGLVIVASAGNSGTNEAHFPASLAETISVGATRESGVLAEFSSWGPTIDLVAPGSNIFSTAINGSYSPVNGTSFSAPIVSAAAAMLLGENPDLSQEHVRNLLKTNSIDLGEKGWDERYGSGRIDFMKVAQNDLKNSLMIHEPLLGSSTSKKMQPIVVSVQDPDMKYLQLDVGIGSEPEQWNPAITDYRYQIIDDTITVLDLTGISDTLLTLRLSVTNFQNQTYEYRSIFRVDRKKPTLSNLKTTHLINENRHAVLVEFTTSEITTGEIYFREQSSPGPFETRNLAYATTNHRFLIDAIEASGDLDFYIIIRDRAGQNTIVDNDQNYYQVYIDESLVDDSPIMQLPWQIPPGHALNEATDLDQDGWDEIVISVYDDQGNYGPVEVYEFDGLKFEKIYQTSFPSIPRSYGDSDQDGKPELFVGYGSISRLLEVSGTDPLSMQIVRQDTGFWASKIADSDADGNYELIVRFGKTYHVLENVGDNQYSEIFVFENPSPGNNSLGSPATHIVDLDGDGFNEFIFGDYDGDIVIFENTGNDAYTWRHTERLPFSDATNYMTIAQFDSNENPILIAGTYTLENISYEHEFDAKYWQFRIINSVEDNIYQNVGKLSIYGFSDLRLFDSGFSAGQLKPDAGESIILAPAPNLYVCRYNDRNLIPEWHADDVQTNTIIVHDFDKDGVNEFYYNDGTQLAGYVLGVGNRPLPPSNFIAVPKDSNKVKLSWYAPEDHDKYIIYRGETELTLTIWDSTDAGEFFTDSLVKKDSTYFYAVQAVNNSYEVTTSALSKIQSARPNNSPLVDSVVVVNTNQIQIFFNENMETASFEAENFLLSPGNIYPGSVISAINGRACILTFLKKFVDQTIYEIEIANVYDIDKTEIDERYRIVSFYYQDLGDLPYIEKYNYSGPKQLDLFFNMPMNSETLLKIENYEITPTGEVVGVEVMDSDARVARLNLSTDVYTGASGVSSYLDLKNIKSIQGRLFSGGNRISLVREAEDLENIFVYPQPARVSQDWLGFANVAPSTRIDIFDLSGRKIISLTESEGHGGIRWNLTNDRGDKLAAGIYLFHARNGDQTKIGKFTIVR